MSNGSTDSTVYSPDQEGKDNVSQHGNYYEVDYSRPGTIRKLVEEIINPLDDFQIEQQKGKQQRNAGRDLYQLMERMSFFQRKINSDMNIVNECTTRIAEIVRGEEEGIDKEYQENFVNAISSDYLDSVYNPEHSKTMKYIKGDFTECKQKLDNVSNILFKTIVEPNEKTRMKLLQQKSEEEEKERERKKKEIEWQRRRDAEAEC